MAVLTWPVEGGALGGGFLHPAAISQTLSRKPNFLINAFHAINRGFKNIILALEELTFFELNVFFRWNKKLF